MTTASLSYKVAGAASATGLSAEHLKREIRAGRLAAKKVGRDYLVLHTELAKWLESLPDAD